MSPQARTEDDGQPDARLAAALRTYDGSAAARGEVLAALAGARVFLVLAARALGTEAAAGGHGVPGRRQEAGAQMQLLSVVAVDGRRALPAFADGHAVQLWRPEARPVPVDGPTACRSVLQDGADALLLDPVGARVAVHGPELPELAAGRVPVSGTPLSTRLSDGLPDVGGDGSPDAGPPAELVRALGQALRDEPVRAARVLDGPDGPVLGVVPRTALGPAGLVALAERVRSRLGPALPPAGMDLAVVPAQGPGTPVELPRRWLPGRRR